MRSEKEIKERITFLENEICRSPQEDEEIRVLEEVLEGEPRYSVAELEKIEKHLEDASENKGLGAPVIITLHNLIFSPLTTI